MWGEACLRRRYAVRVEVSAVSSGAVNNHLPRLAAGRSVCPSLISQTERVMSDSTTVGTWIGVAATAVSAIVTIATAYLRSRTKEKLSAIQKGGAVAAQVVSNAVTSYRLNTAKLNARQVFELAKAEIAARDQRHARNLRISLGFAGIATITTVVLTLIATQRPTAPLNPSAEDAVVRSPTDRARSESVASDSNATDRSSNGECRDSDLALTMEVAGDLIPGHHEPVRGHYASGRLYQFTLANISAACTAVVANIQFEALASVEDNHPMLEATTAENQYEVVVKPTDVGKLLELTPLEGAPRPKWNFSYPPRSNPDRFAIHVVPSQWGYSYAIRFVVSWYDPRGRRNYITKSDVYAAYFPEGQGPIFSSEAALTFRRSQAAAWEQQLGVPVLVTLSGR